MSNTFDKLSVLDSFIEEVNSYLPEIEVNLDSLAQQASSGSLQVDLESLQETYRRTHTIGGSASMMDFPGLAHVAHGMEDILGDVLEGVAFLDPATIGLLQRSLGRMHYLLDGIRDGIDENAVIAEDDADYSRYRAEIELAALAGANEADRDQRNEDQSQITAPQPPVKFVMPSLDEVLASFRTPQLAAGEEAAWPEEPHPASSFSAEAEQDTQPRTRTVPSRKVVPSEEQPQQPSALDVLIGTSQEVPPLTSGTVPKNESEQAQSSISDDLYGNEEVPMGAQHPETVVSAQVENVAVPVVEAPQLAAGQQGEATPLQQEAIFWEGAFAEMQGDTQVLDEQASFLKKTLSQLRQTVSVIEEQRAEFRSFLDGSRDALDRMEEWAGQAMGLNLRNSPEQVRRYLPLSVMWVANTKLKKVLELLNSIANSMEMSDEQMQTALQQLHSSIEACGNAFFQLQSGSSTYLFTQQPGWTTWEMQASALGERVTFERHGDPAGMRAEIETRVREELRREYENRPLSLTLRKELEQQIRKEVREEFEAKRQLQKSVSGIERGETLQELEARLRNEIEIEVRQTFLRQINVEVDQVSAPTSSSPPTLSYAATSTAQAPELEVEPGPTSEAASVGTDFFEEAADLFRAEADEHLQTISMHVASLENAPTDRNLIQGIRRATHTLKGAAGMMGFHAIADLCHILEDLLDSVIEDELSISAAVLSLILDTTEALDLLIHEKGIEGSGNESVVESLRPRYIELLGEQRALPGLTGEEEEEIDAQIEDNTAALSGSSVVSSVVGDSQSSGIVNAQRTVPGDLTVRVPLQKLDELVNLFGELLVNRSALEERLQRLMHLVAEEGISSARLRDVGQKLESRFEAATLPSGRSVQVMPGQGNANRGYTADSNGRGTNNSNEPSHLAEFDELELDRYTEFHQLARGLSEGISDMTTLSTEMEAVIRECEGVFGRENRLSTTFQDRLMKARLVPISTMIPRLYRTARAVALKQHKEFEFVLEGQETEVDRTVIEEIAGPLLHLMRNAVNHAIETPEMRLEKGKPAAGRIELAAAYEGNRVVITVRDDGTGIDPERIRNTAIDRGIISADQALGESDLIDLIFRPGFSTAEVLSEESGRGVGLDVVRDSVSRLRGTLEVESTPGQGTAFTMKFPTTLAIQNAMMVQVGDQQFAIPTVVVEAIGRLDTYKHTIYGGRPAILTQNDVYPLIELAQILGIPSGVPDEKAPVLLVNTGRQRVALIVDNIKSRMDVVMKNLGPHLRHVEGIAGGTVLGNGRVILILELLELLATPRGTMRQAQASSVRQPMPAQREDGTAASASPRVPIEVYTDRRRIAISTPPSAPAADAERGKHILVVDDSASVRRVVGNMLKQYGWEVRVARDGVEALEMITQETPAAVLLDIEMPRMDGYELMATVRAQEQYRSLPIVILTSRAAAKHQQRAMQLGANAYVVKPYQDEELINTLNSLVYGATVR